MAYAQRLERDIDAGVKEAFRVLHQGLSCLAGQINATDSHSAHVAAQLTSNWEQLARRLSEIRVDFDDSSQVLDARLSVSEKSAQYNSSALEHALEKIEALVRQRAMDQLENQRQAARHEQVLERLSDTLLRLVKSLPDSNFTHRLEALEKDHCALLSELRARMFESAPQSLIAVEPSSLDEPPALELTESGVALDFDDIFTQPEPEPENFLAQARMSARVSPDVSRPRYFFPAAMGLVAVLALAVGLMLQQRVERVLAAKPALALRTHSLPQPGSDDKSAATERLEPGSQVSAPHALVPVKQRVVSKQPVNPVPDGPKPNPKQDGTPSPLDDRVKQLAGQGNPLALTILGFRAADGTDGAAVNLPDAVKYLTRAAENGQAVAQYRLGTFYEHGQGVAVDSAKAARWYELSAAQGNRKAMHNLAVFYASRKDLANAARWFAKAAALGLSDSQFNLAVLYERGDGLPQSLVDAFKWYSIAAASGDVESKARVAALQTQLSEADKAIAAKAVDAFRPLALDRAANVPPETSELPSG